MRISAGKLKGRNILAPEGREVRPTSAKVRESIFDSLQAQVGGSRFLDLFAGSGAVGIEAFSRGAAEVYFCERGREVLPLLKQNVALLKGAGKVYEGDSFALLERLPGAFDIIFADPPYKEDCLERICAVCVRRGLLAEDGIIVYEHAAEKKVAAPEGFRIVKSKRYGSAALEYIRRGSICAVTGSFDPMTRGHGEVARRARAMFGEAGVGIAGKDTKPSAFPLEVREKIAKKALEGLENVSVDICEGYVYKYCNKKGIPVIVRGLRGEQDREYEEFMARYNLEKGGVSTVFTSAEGLTDISSTALRKALAEEDEKAIERLCAPGTSRLVKEEYKKLHAAGGK